jgi:hypothetical protein
MSDELDPMMLLLLRSIGELSPEQQVVLREWCRENSDLSAGAVLEQMLDGTFTQAVHEREGKQ